MTNNKDQTLPSVTSSKKDSFAMKLYRILSNPKFHNIIAWQPHGRSWRVLEPKLFEKEVLPHYFRHRNYSSFMRQVNGWGFRRIQKGIDRHTFYHAQFMREMPHMCSQMERPKKEETLSRSGSYSSVGPDFYDPALSTLGENGVKRKEIQCTQASNTPSLDMHINVSEYGPKRMRLNDMGAFVDTEHLGFGRSQNNILQQLQQNAIVSQAMNNLLSPGVTASEAQLRSIDMKIIAVEKEIWLRQQRRRQNQLLSVLSCHAPMGMAMATNQSLDSLQGGLNLLQH